MRMLVTGGSSFLGAHLCRVAAERHEVHALFHSTPVRLNRVTPMRVDLRRARDVERMKALEPDLVVHLACRIKAPGPDSPAENAARLNRQMMDAVLAVGAPVVYASSTVVHWDTETPYGRSRREDEARLAESGLPWAVLRPSAPYGPALLSHHPGHEESFHLLARLVGRLPLVPVISDGQYRRQPVHVADFAEAVLALGERGLPGRAFEAGGATAHRFDEIIQLIARAMDRRVWPLHLPKAAFVAAARWAPDFDPTLIAAIDQDELAPPAELEAATGVRMRGFAEGVDELVRSL
jgi:nucleoside-diphosphate-sugar epimerase